MSVKSKKQQQRYIDFLCEIDSVSPASSSVVPAYQKAHDELFVLMNIGRVMLAEAVSTKVVKSIDWSKFTSDSTTHRNITSDEAIDKFLLSKVSE